MHQHSMLTQNAVYKWMQHTFPRTCHLQPTRWCRTKEPTDIYSELVNQDTVLDYIVSTPTLSTLLLIIQDPRFAAVRSWLRQRSVTLFAPTNHAFVKANLNFSDVPQVQALLHNLIIPNRTVILSAVGNSELIPSLQGVGAHDNSSPLCRPDHDTERQ